MVFLKESFGSNGGGEERARNENEEDGAGDGAGFRDESQREDSKIEGL